LAKTSEVLHPFLKQPPDDPGLLFAWGTALVRTRQSGLAAEIFRRLLEQNSSNPAVHLLLGQAYAQQEDYSNSITQLKSALQLDSAAPGSALFSWASSTSARATSNLPPRNSAPKLAIRPGDPAASYHLGFSLLMDGHPDQAVTIFREVVSCQARL